MNILIKILAVILLISLCFGTTISFTGTFDYLSGFFETIQSGIETVKGIVGLDVFNLPVNSKVIADKIIDGKSIKQRLYDQYVLMRREAYFGEYNVPLNLNVDNILAVNENLFYVELEGVVVEAIKFTYHGKWANTGEEFDFDVLWLNPTNLLNNDDLRDEDYVWYDGIFNLGNEYTTFYYYSTDFALLPIKDFNSISGQVVFWGTDLVNNFVSITYYPLDAIYPASDISLNDYMQVIGVYDPNV